MLELMQSRHDYNCKQKYGNNKKSIENEIIKTSLQTDVLFQLVTSAARTTTSEKLYNAFFQILPSS